MVKFCPECSNLLRKKMMSGEYFIVCKCGYKEKWVSKDKEDIKRKIEKKKEALSDNLIIVSNEEKIFVYPKTSKICSKCGNTEAVYWQEQLFSADEPMVTFFRCIKCSNVWREY